jgi:hypothetical protein
MSSKRPLFFLKLKKLFWELQVFAQSWMFSPFVPKSSLCASARSPTSNQQGDGRWPMAV